MKIKQLIPTVVPTYVTNVECWELRGKEYHVTAVYMAHYLAVVTDVGHDDIVPVIAQNELGLTWSSEWGVYDLHTYDIMKQSSPFPVIETFDKTLDEDAVIEILEEWERNSRRKYAERKIKEALGEQ